MQIRHRHRPFRIFILILFSIVNVIHLSFWAAKGWTGQGSEIDNPPTSFQTSFLEAARQNDIDQARLQLKAGVPIDTRDEQGNTALHLAVFNNAKAMVLLLLKAGAEVNAQNEFGLTPLHLVKEKSIAQILVARGADINAKDKEFGMTPIFFHDVPVAQVLLKAGADVNARGKKGNTPILWYAYNNYLAGIKLLVANGANPSAVNEEGSSALSIAKRFGYHELAKYLKTLARSGKRHSGKKLPH